MKFYKCLHCGQVLYSVVDAPVTPQCCGEKMVELKAGSTDAATEKHVPSLAIEGDRLVARVGEVAHPMLEEHSIQFIAVDYGNGSVSFAYLKPGDEPVAEFAKPQGKATVYEYCNLHGLWKSEIEA